MADISALLANAAQTNTDFDLGKLNKSYWEGRDQYAKNDLRDAFKDGLPMQGGQPDYPSMVKTLIQKGALEQGLAVAKLAQDQQNLAESQRISGVVNGGAPLPVSVNRPGGVADPAFRRDTSTDQPAQPPTPLPPDQRQDPNSNVYRMPQQQAVQDWRDSVRPAVGGAQPQVQPQPQPAPPPPQVAQAPQAPAADFNSRFNAARPGQGSDPTLGGLVPPGRTVKQQIDLLSEAVASGTLRPELAKAYQARLEAIYKAIEPTNPIKEYDKAVSQGFKGTLEDWQNRTDENTTQRDILNKSLLPRVDKSQETALASVKDIEAIHNARTELDQSGGVFSGKWGDMKLQAGKVAALLGIGNIDKITNTESYGAAIGQRVAAMVKAFGSGTAISDGDRKFAAAMAGGNIELNETSMRRILDIGEKADRALIDRHNNFADKVVKSNEGLKSARDTLIVEQPGAYKKQTAGPAAGAPQIGEIRTNAHGVKGKWNGTGYEVIR